MAVGEIVGLIIVLVIIMFYVSQYTHFGQRIKEQIFGLTSPYVDNTQGNPEAAPGSLEREVPGAFVEYANNFVEKLFVYQYDETKFNQGQVFALNTFTPEKKDRTDYSKYELRLLESARGIEAIVYNTKNQKQYLLGSSQNDYTPYYQNFKLCVLPVNQDYSSKYAFNAFAAGLGIGQTSPLKSQSNNDDIYVSSIYFKPYGEKPLMAYTCLNGTSKDFGSIAHTGNDVILFYQYGRSICVFPTVISDFRPHSVYIDKNKLLGSGLLDESLLSDLIKSSYSFSSKIIYR